MAYQQKVKKLMEQQGYLVINLIKMGVAGYPDLLCIKEGECTFIECKEGNDTLKPLQKYKIDELISNGCNAYCIHDVKGIIYPK